MITEGHMTGMPQSDSQPLLYIIIGKSVLEKSNRTIKKSLVMSKIKKSLVLNTHVTLFDGKD